MDLFYPKTWPCDYFPVLRAILAGKCAWKLDKCSIIYNYLKHHLVFEIKCAYRKVKSKNHHS